MKGDKQAAKGGPCGSRMSVTEGPSRLHRGACCVPERETWYALFHGMKANLISTSGLVVGSR